MTFKVVRSLLVLLFVITLVIGGTTVAWFTAKSDFPSAAKMVVGTLEFEITDASVYSEQGVKMEEEAIEWQAGESKKFSWTLKNTGSETSFFRARAGSILKFPVQRESAWGEAFSYNKVDDQRGCLTHHQGQASEAVLFANQQHEVGMVRAWEERNKLCVEFATKDGWQMIETHLALIESRSDLPMNKKGDVVPLLFPHKRVHKLAESYTYVLDLPHSNPVCLAVHAIVEKGTSAEADDQILWSLPVEPALFAGNQGCKWSAGSDDWFYCYHPVKNEETIVLELQGHLPAEAEGGLCCVQLQVEAVQASQGAVDDAQWPGGSSIPDMLN